MDVPYDTEPEATLSLNDHLWLLPHLLLVDLVQNSESSYSYRANSECLKIDSNLTTSSLFADLASGNFSAEAEPSSHDVQLDSGGQLQRDVRPDLHKPGESL